MGDHEDEKQEEESTKRKMQSSIFCSLQFGEKEIPAVNVDNLQTFKPDFLPTFNAFADQDKQNHFLLRLQAAGR